MQLLFYFFTLVIKEQIKIMLAKELLTYSLPALKPSDTGQIALELMEQYKVSHLPLVEDEHYLNLVSEDDIYDYELENIQFSQAKLKPFAPYVTENQSIYEILTLLSKIKISVLPVLSKKNTYLGSIIVGKLIFDVIKLFGLDEEGAVLIFRIKKRDYSIVQIGQIIEANNAKVLSFFTIPVDKDFIKLVIKLNTKDVVSLLQTFERYDYEVDSVLFDDEKYNEIFKERYDALMNFLKI